MRIHNRENCRNRCRFSRAYKRKRKLDSSLEAAKVVLLLLLLLLLVVLFLVLVVLWRLTVARKLIFCVHPQLVLLLSKIQEKNLQKRVCHVPSEGLSSDMWAWRTYGQKPIKGSPYPRGYYRCSSSKGCLARKQVERNRSNPKMSIITYTSEHNHPMPTHWNSLAGSTRMKPSTTSTEAEPPASQGSGSLAVVEKGEVKAKCEEEMGKDIVDDSRDGMELEDMVMNDDLFVGFGKLDDSDGGDLFPDQIQRNLEMGCPWIANNSGSATTTTTTTTCSRAG